MRMPKKIRNLVLTNRDCSEGDTTTAGFAANGLTDGPSDELVSADPGCPGPAAAAAEAVGEIARSREGEDNGRRATSRRERPRQPGTRMLLEEPAERCPLCVCIDHTEGWAKQSNALLGRSDVECRGRDANYARARNRLDEPAMCGGLKEAGGGAPGGGPPNRERWTQHGASCDRSHLQRMHNERITGPVAQSINQPAS